MARQGVTQVGLRVPNEVLERMHAEAAKSGRSANAEMVARLEASVAADAQVEAAQEKVKELTARMRAQESRIRDLEGMTRDLTNLLVAERFESHAQIQQARADMPDDRPPDEEWPDPETERRALESVRTQKRGRGSK